MFGQRFVQQLLARFLIWQFPSFAQRLVPRRNSRIQLQHLLQQPPVTLAQCKCESVIICLNKLHLAQLSILQTPNRLNLNIIGLTITFHPVPSSHAGYTSEADAHNARPSPYSPAPVHSSPAHAPAACETLLFVVPS